MLRDNSDFKKKHFKFAIIFRNIFGRNFYIHGKSDDGVAVIVLYLNLH